MPYYGTQVIVPPIRTQHSSQATSRTRLRIEIVFSPFSSFLFCICRTVPHYCCGTGTAQPRSQKPNGRSIHPSSRCLSPVSVVGVVGVVDVVGASVGRPSHRLLLVRRKLPLTVHSTPLGACGGQSRDGSSQWPKGGRRWVVVDAGARPSVWLVGVKVVWGEREEGMSIVASS